jgi:hypothetical protein
MKTQILILTVTLLLGFTDCGQSGKNVPDPVKSAFSQKFPGATMVKWGRENDREWEAEFQMNGKNYSANFSNEGTWMETEYEVSIEELPSAVKSTLDRESAGLKIKLSEVTETENGTAFEFVLRKGETGTELVIDNTGTIVKKEQLKEEDENDETEEEEGN